MSDSLSSNATSAGSPTRHRMTAAERGASLSLAAIFALRMLGLFVVLPVFVIEARRYTGGNDPALVGFAMGVYGLAQAVMQAPLGIASDRIGRKKIIVAGLAIFALGSVVAALADSIYTLAAGRALQGAGAVSAAVTALLADLTRDEVRTKGMALIGISIGLTFAVSLMISPVLTGWIGLSGLFWLTGALTLMGIAVVLWWTPDEPAQHADIPRGRIGDVLLHPKLWRLDIGIFVLHTVQMSMWVVVPTLLERAGLPATTQWKVYLPTVLASFLLLGGVFSAERRGRLGSIWRASIVLLALVQVAFFLVAPRALGIWPLAWILFFFFVAFNVLESVLPSMVSQLAPVQARGAALGVYNTMQSIGLFVGGALGGWLVKDVGASGLFAATAVLALIWLVLGWAQPMPASLHGKPH